MNLCCSRVGKKLASVVVGALICAISFGQAAPKQSQAGGPAVVKPDVSVAIAKAQSDSEDSIYFVEQVARAGAVQAIPALEQKFERTQDPIDKAHVASALVRLGDKNSTYWEFLKAQAEQSIESDAPDFMSYDSKGKAMPGPSTEFVAWAKAHNLSANEMGEQQTYIVPAPVILLAQTADPRAIPLLREALLSRNHQIQIFGAKGLAQLQDHDSVGLIIQASRKAPAEVAAAIAESLVYFDEPEAQQAVDEYMPKDAAENHRRARAKGAKPF